MTIAVTSGEHQGEVSTQIQYIDKSVLSRVETVKSQIVQKSPQV